MTLLVDGCGIHGTDPVKEMYEELDIKIIKNLVARPDLNAIERYWAQAKIIFRRKLFGELLVRDKVAIKSLVTESLLAVNNELTKRIAVNGVKRLKDRQRIIRGLI